MKFSELAIGDLFTTYEVYLNLNSFYEKTDLGSASITIHGNEIRVPFSQDTIVYPISMKESDKQESKSITDFQQSGNVNHPSHYGGADNPYEAIKIIDALGLTKGFCLGSAIKYIVREGSKQDNPAVQDLQKAAWYINYYIDYLNKKEGASQ